MKKIILSAAFALISLMTFAQNPIGVWKTIDDESGKEKSYVEIYVDGNGKYHGKITQLLQKPADTRCEKCPGDKKGQLLVGMEILWGVWQSGSEWKGGRILDPEKGVDYGCKFWFEGGKTDELKVRGYHWSGIFRTQTWYRIK